MPAPALTYYRAELKKSKPAIDYLKGRGLTGEIAARYGMGYAPDGWQNLHAAFADYSAKALVAAGRSIGQRLHFRKAVGAKSYLSFTNTRGGPKRCCRPRVSPYTPAIASAKIALK